MSDEGRERADEMRAIAEAAKYGAIVQTLQATLRLVDNLIALVRELTSADAGRPDREQLLRELRERREPLQRLLDMALLRDPSLDLRNAQWGEQDRTH